MFKKISEATIQQPKLSDFFILFSKNLKCLNFISNVEIFEIFNFFRSFSRFQNCFNKTESKVI